MVDGESLTVYPQLEKGNVATSYAPYRAQPYIDDITNVTVKKCGKNLFNFKSGAKSYTYKDKSGEKTNNGYKVELPAGTYTFHAEKIVANNEHYLYGYINNAKGEYVSKGSMNLIIGKDTPARTVTLDPGDVVYFVDLGISNTDLDIVNDRFNDEWNIQVEYGDNQTDYEEYNEEIYYVSEDGVVGGIYNSPPIMNLISSPYGVIMDCVYLRDIDTYIDNLIINIAMTGGQ